MVLLIGMEIMGKLKARRWIVSVTLMVAAMVPLDAPAEETEVQYLSGRGKDDPVAWEFYCTGGRKSGEWTTIGVPSNWELEGFGTYNYGHNRPKADEQGKYRRTFEIPEGWSDKRIFLVFDGVMTDTEVSVNGQSAGPTHQGGFYRFKYEITDLVEPGENLLEVTVSKVSSNASVEAAERKADYWVFGGIFRPVWLEAVPKQFVEWIAIDAKADGSFLVDVHLKGTGRGDSVRAEIVRADGAAADAPVDKVVQWSGDADGSFELQMGVELGSGERNDQDDAFVSKPFEGKLGAGQKKATLRTQVRGHEPWTAETPNLYAVRVELRDGDEVIHAVTERFGFRTFEVRPGDGLYLNGQKIRLKGVCRHSFWPDSGRCLSREISYQDVRLMKAMNMNAVRMSHYPPDKHFLEACDELGLYVLDELAGWQKPPYDTDVGRKLVKEMVTRDVCHPCILFWDNANEGGWNRELDDQFALYDPQNRTVLHPWENFNGVDTDHYESYASTQKKLSGSTPFLPTEFLHGLYDGGHGAGLNDYWNAMLASPLGAGGFLWVLADEGVVRTDQDGKIDTDGNHAPDGIVGPYRQKEGSFYTIKEIWSPVQVAMEELPKDFDGTLRVWNRYDFTNLADCTFEVRLADFPSPRDEADGHTPYYRHSFPGPELPPHADGLLRLGLPPAWHEADVLYLTAYGPGREKLWTWSWDIQGPRRYVDELVVAESTQQVTAKETAGEIRFTAGQLDLVWDRGSGSLRQITHAGEKISFDMDLRLIGGEGRVVEGGIRLGPDNRFVQVHRRYEGDMRRVLWTIYPSGWIALEYEYALDGEFDLFGVDLEYPESRMRSMRFLGAGPYRVWKNRLKGGVLDVWTNEYKDHVPGVTWDFPEFRGYYKDWRWVVFETEQGEITIVNETPELYLGVYRPNDGPDPARTKLNVPETGVAFLHGIPPIGTKFRRPEALGPESRKNEASGTYQGKVWFYFGE